MSPRHPFPLLVPHRVSAALQRLEKLIWGPEQPLEVEATAPRADYLTFAEAIAQPRGRVAAPQHWGQLYDQRWCRVVLPAERGTGARLRWKDQGEATLYVDGVPYAGFDALHETVELPAGVTEVWVECLCARAGIWVGPRGLDAAGSAFGGAVLTTRDDAAFEAHVILDYLHRLARAENRDALPLDPHSGYHFGPIRPLESASPFYRRLLRALDEAVDAFDRGGVAALRGALDELMARFPATSDRLRVVLTGHAHIDLVWLWPERVGERKAVHTFASMLRLMERDAAFHFGYSQAASYRAVERIAPALMEQVRGRVREGRWEPTGALWVESDTLIACGEALLRGLRLGQEAFAALTGSRSRVVWLPDVFGYSACLPQLMRLEGAEFFFTSKLTWSTINPFPHSSFRWVGHDGSEVVAHVSQRYGYNETVDPAALRDAERAYRQADVHDALLIPTGIGDGGGGTSEEMLIRAQVAGRMAGVPRAEWGRIDAFFDGLNAVRGDLPAWQGELYLEYHRGTYTTHGEVKAAFRAAERALQVLEAAQVATGRGAVDRRRWERVVFAQFHDYIPGSSVEEVYREGVAELTALATDSLADAEAALGDGEVTACFNPLALRRTAVVGAAGARRVIEVPPLAAVAVASAATSDAEPVVASATEIANGRVRAGFDARGRVTRLEFDGREVALAGPAAGLELFVDRPAAFDAWDVDRQALDLGEPLDGAVAVRVRTVDACEAAVEFTRRFGAASEVTTRYRLVAGEAALRVEFDVDFQEPQRWLKVHVPTRYAGGFARFGAPFGSVLRGQQAGHSWDEAQWEVPASRWAVVADDAGTEGLAVITEAKYGFRARDGVLSVSLVRSPVPSGGENDPGPGLYPAGIRREPSPSFTDLGRQQIRLALAPYRADLERERQPAALADVLFAPFLAAAKTTEAGLAGIDGGASLVPTWAEPLAEGRWALRLNETLGARGTATVRAAPGWVARFEGASGAAVEVPFTPYALLTVEFARG